MFGLTPTQIFQLCQFAVFPALFWMLKWAVKELKEAVDDRADKAASKRIAEVREQLAVFKAAMQHQFDTHELKDEQRHRDIIELIATIKT